MSALISPFKKSGANFFVLGLIILLVSCSKNEQSDSQSQRTVIVYMVANNNLYQNAIADINEMEKGCGNYNGHLIVYLCPQNENPYLLEIQSDNSNEIVSKVVKRYPQQNSCSVSVMQSVYNDIMELYPAKSYGTILWSHATGWLPSNTPSIFTLRKESMVSSDVPSLKSFGDDNGKKMEIEELAEALPKNLDFIIFDACLMANVESAYELRNNTAYILGSSTEVLSTGYPYNEIMPYLFSTEANLEKIAEKYFNYYDEKEGLYRSATASLIKTSELEGLAAACKQIVDNNEIQTFNLGDIQKLDTWHNPVFFGFMSFMKSAYANTNLDALSNQVNKVVIYERHTPKFFNEIELKIHSGISAYIPNIYSGSLNDAYYRTKWATASGFIKYQQVIP